MAAGSRTRGDGSVGHFATIECSFRHHWVKVRENRRLAARSPCLRMPRACRDDMTMARFIKRITNQPKKTGGGSRMKITAFKKAAQMAELFANSLHTDENDGTACRNTGGAYHQYRGNYAASLLHFRQPLIWLKVYWRNVLTFSGVAQQKHHFSPNNVSLYGQHIGDYCNLYSPTMPTSSQRFRTANRRQFTTLTGAAPRYTFLAAVFFIS